MTKLSVNINKIAVLRNSRGGNVPNLLKTALDIERFGADGITVHPRPDERHIKYADVFELKANIKTELNVEGNCTEDKFVQLVLDTLPEQVTLVPDVANAITSSAGWDTVKHFEYLKSMVSVFKNVGIRVSIFVDPIEEMIVNAAKLGTDRIELYTESYAANYFVNKQKSVETYTKAAIVANQLGLGINAGHDLSLDNLRYFKQQVPFIDEVSIGHALIADALYLGLENTVQLYQRELLK
jgi:pyridoxine 5-phosphate synthase